MTTRPTNPLKSILHPYIFVLKEGNKIKNDFLDYSLMMLFVHSTETIHSPFEDCLLPIIPSLDKPLKTKKKTKTLSKS